MEVIFLFTNAPLKLGVNFYVICSNTSQIFKLRYVFVFNITDS